MKNLAFTMAELLITLGVIGVVIAMTLPALVQNYNNHLTETRLKKFYTIMNQAILQSVNENGPYEGWDYWISAEQDENGTYISKADSIDANFKRYIGKYIKYTTEKVQDSTGTTVTLYKLTDGSSFQYTPDKTHNREIVFYPANAKKCLNLARAKRSGVCAFSFEFYPLINSKDWKYLYKKGLEPFLFHWDGNEASLYNNAQYSCLQGEINGNYCTAIIQRNGWKVPKNYPKRIKY
ncbi:hypothetical protein DBY21_04675 [Candidatus Gastranaerophilales bacterium]|nr:MAG: hypothetical protein DBY21_04675 [Candidatus Gastranaerophilales bacterium]